MRENPLTDIAGEKCVLITPHTAFYTTVAVTKVNALVCANIIDVMSGRRSRFAVNPEALVRNVK